MNPKSRIRSHSGFTLVEIMVVVVVLFTVGVTASQLFFSILKGGSKSTILGAVKQNGDYALSVMERMIRNSTAITSCDVTSLTIQNQDGGTTTFTCSGTQISSNSASLTSNNVAVSCASLFNCQLPQRKITIIFDVSESVAAPKVEETARMNFQTTVTLRNYRR